MSQEDPQLELRQKTQRLLNGSLKHARAAALAIALVPLASVAISLRAVARAQGSGGAPPGGTVPSPCDFVTSGGFVISDTGKELNFGAHGGCKLDGFWGHLNYVDHDTGYHVDSLDITGYLTPSPGSNIREIAARRRPIIRPIRNRSISVSASSTTGNRASPICLASDSRMVTANRLVTASRRACWGRHARRRQRPAARAQPVNDRSKPIARRSHDVQRRFRAIGNEAKQKTSGS